MKKYLIIFFALILNSCEVKSQSNKKITYYDTGEKKMEYTEINGEANGPSVYYYKNGNKNREAVFKDGEIEGKILIYRCSK